MEITVLTKARYNELLWQIKNLGTHIAVLHGQVTAMQNSNNELAEIAFDENKFTTQLMDKVWDTAERAAKDAIDEMDIDDIAREVANNMDINEEVERCADRMGFVNKDDVNDMIQDHINDESLVNEGQVEDLISDYIQHNCDFVEKDVTDQLHEDIQELKQNIHAIVKDEVNKAIQTLINKLTAKENDHATGTHDYSLQVSGAANQSEGSSDAAAAA